jgi:hypothetical protein
MGKFNCKRCCDTSECCPEAITPPDISISGWTEVSEGWSGSGCCWSKEFTRASSGVESTSCSGVTQELEYEEICNFEAVALKAPKRPYVVGVPTCPITDEECCYGGEEVIATALGTIHADYQVKLRLITAKGNLVVFYGKSSYTCGEDTVCKYYLATLYPMEWNGSMDIYRDYSRTVDWTCNTCYECYDDISETETDCTDCDVEDCPPFLSASLGTGTVYFFRLNLYDSEPTGTQTIDQTPDCDSGAPCFVDNGLYGYVDEFCLSSSCVEIIPPTIGTETWSVTYEGPTCNTKFGYIECEDFGCTVATQGCTEKVCSDLTINFSCDNTLPGEIPDPATCVYIAPYSPTDACPTCGDGDAYNTLYPRDFTKRCGTEGVPGGTPYVCFSTDCCWIEDCRVGGTGCIQCHDKWIGVVGANSERTITYDNGTYTPAELCIPAEIITVVLS